MGLLNFEHEERITAASEKISGVLNSRLFTIYKTGHKGSTVYNELAKVLGIEIDCDSDIWIEIDRFIAEKLFEMEEANKEPLVCEMCGDEMDQEDHDISDICGDCLEGEEDEDDTDCY